MFFNVGIANKLVKLTETFKYPFIVCMTNMENLLKNVRMFLTSANLVYDQKDYTSSAILYFKCLFVLLDYIILKDLGKTPKDHTERFRILQKDYPEFYVVLDKLFSVYRNTYSLTISKIDCDKVKEDVQKIIKEYKIQINS